MFEETVVDAPAEESPVDETSVDETPVDDAPEADDASADSEGIDDASEEEEAPEEAPVEEVPADGRKMPDGLKKAIAGLKATSPEVAKQIKGLYYANEEFQKAFPTPADAITAKTIIEEIGGPEGIQEIQAEREEWGQIDRDFAEGKKEFVTSLADNNPEGFLKTAPHVINEFAQRAPDQYQYYANNVALNTLSNSGLTIDNLASAYHRYANNPEAQAIIAEVHNSLVGLKEKAAQFEQKRMDPREEQLKQRETKFEQERRADFEGRVANDAETYLSTKMQPEIDRVIGGRKVDPEAMKGYQSMVKAEVEKRLGQIPGFADKLEAHYRTGDAKKSLDYVQKQYNRILPEAAKVIEPFLRNIAPAKAKAAAAAPVAGKSAAPGEITLREMPDYSQIDFNKCTVADVMQGNAVLKNGKKASGWA